MNNYGIKVGDSVEWREPSEIGSLYRGKVLALCDYPERAWVQTGNGELHTLWTGLLNKAGE